MAEVLVEGMTRRFGAVTAIEGISFTVRSGEFLTLLGPSGCGKSTTLGGLAGFDRPSAGRIVIGGRVVFDSARGVFVDAQYRGLGLMFQSYALWPHMTVYRNIAFGLELRRVRGQAARERVAEVLAMVEMEGFAERYPGELSGGQQQRIALARTLAYRPEILLLDEPLSNLDTKLREKARLWLADLQRRTGVTTIYVTHDQAEALSLSDRIIVMNRGRIAQIGTPQAIYREPADAFVADFVGSSNLFEAELGRAADGTPEARLGETRFALAPSRAGEAAGRVTIGLRPEDLALVDTPGPESLPCTVLSRSYLGARMLILVDLAGQALRVEAPASAMPGNTAFLRIPPEAVRVFR